MGTLQVVVGGQYGSESKGAIAAWLAQTEHVHAVRVAGPNAGHTVIDPLTNTPVALRCIPTAAVVNPEAALYIAAGSEVDAMVLMSEIKHLEDDLQIKVGERLRVDRQATMLLESHRQAETDLVTRIGSTGKGIGAARAERIMRTVPVTGEVTWPHGAGSVIDTGSALALALADGGTIIIEGTQGYGLGLHAGAYPQCTSSDCRAIDFMAMAGISPWSPGVDTMQVWVVLRTYPIRVAGNSGPMSNEITWGDVSRRAGRQVQEKTTVTQKVRRVGEWDSGLARDAIHANGGPSVNVKIALTFVDYIVPGVANKTGNAVRSDIGVQEYVRWIESEIGCAVSAVSTGPAHVTKWAE